jgi:hypothetical protein
MQEKHDQFREDMSDLVKELIEQSEQIRENCLQQFQSEHQDEGFKQESQNKMKYLLMQLQKVPFSIFTKGKINFQSEVGYLNLLKNHLLVLHQTIFEMNKRLIDQGNFFN